MKSLKAYAHIIGSYKGMLLLRRYRINISCQGKFISFTLTDIYILVYFRLLVIEKKIKFKGGICGFVKNKFITTKMKTVSIM